MLQEDDITSNVVNITERLERLRIVAAAKDAAAATVELEGLAHALRQLDLVLRVHLQFGEPVENHEEIADYLSKVKAELLDHMRAFGLVSRQRQPNSSD